VTRASATAKLNLALVVGPVRAEGKHEVVTVIQRLALADRVELTPGEGLTVEGFADDTLVRGALTSLALEAGVRPGWRARITKHIPVSSGLGGGSSDAATALLLANATLDEPLAADRLHALARRLGADVPFFLTSGPQLGEEEGGALTPLELPQDYFVLLVLPRNAAKPATAAVYEDFDRRNGADGYEARRAALLESVSAVVRPRDLAALPANDLVSSPLAEELRALGAFRADVSGAGPTVYGLFQHRRAAVAARNRLRSRGRTWLTAPAWYG
jgi:4-diphosphocytidyl-2-C-methyl-D-erythritol kinase